MFTRSGSTWTQQGGKLTGTGETGAGGFGVGVALSADGNTALIGGPADSSNVGAAWVFTRTGGAWTQQGGKLTGSGGISIFGYRVRHRRGVVVGREHRPDRRPPRRFCRDGGGVGLHPHRRGLVAAGRQADRHRRNRPGGFGWSVALSADGNLGLIGAPGDAGGSGKAYWFARTAGTWSQLTSSGVGTGAVGNARFGSSVAMSSDGSIALIGGNEDGNTATQQGRAAWVFTRSGNTWSQQGGKLTGSGETGPAEFGYVAALSSDGNTGADRRPPRQHGRGGGVGVRDPRRCPASRRR